MDTGALSLFDTWGAAGLRGDGARIRDAGLRTSWSRASFGPGADGGGRGGAMFVATDAVPSYFPQRLYHDVLLSCGVSCMLFYSSDPLFIFLI